MTGSHSPSPTDRPLVENDVRPPASEAVVNARDVALAYGPGDLQPGPPPTPSYGENDWLNIGHTSELPDGVHLELQVRGSDVCVSVHWPITVPVDEGVDTLELRDITDLVVAIIGLGLDDRYESTPLDLVGILLQPVTFGSAGPVVGGCLAARAAAEEVTPGCRLALDLYVATVLGRRTLPAWLQEIVEDIVLS